MFDDYERKFVDAKLRTAGNQRADQESSIHEIIELWEDAAKTNGHAVDGLLKSDLLPRLSHWVLRSITYERFYDFVGTKLAAEDAFFNRIAIAQLVTPLLAQELEGTVKWSILTWGFLGRVCKKEVIDWQDYHLVQRGKPSERPKYLKEAIDDVRFVFPTDSAPFQIADGLEPPDHPVRSNLVRRAVAHGDFIVIGDPREPIVQFLGGESLDIPFTECMGLFSMTQDLAKMATVGNHLGARRALAVLSDPAGSRTMRPS